MIVFLLVLFVQVLGLAVQVKRPTDRGPTRLIRLWGVGLITPAEKAMVHTQNWAYHVWKDYFYLRDVRRENERLQEENLRLRLEQVRMAEDAGQAQRLQALFKFKEQFICETVAAQVIGSSGSETSNLIYVDKGERDGIRTDMAVLSPTGVIGKVVRVFAGTAQVIEINDQSSGVGALLEKSRLQGILKGTPAGETMVHYIMSDEKVEVGEMVVTSGGDRIFPKGLPIGQVVQVSPGPEMFLNIRVKPAARLDHLEEVLIITKVDERQPELAPEAPVRAADILAQRLPGVPVKPPDASTGVLTPPAGTQAGAGQPAAAASIGPRASVTTKNLSSTTSAVQPGASGLNHAVKPGKPASNGNAAAAPAVGGAPPSGQLRTSPGANKPEGGNVPKALKKPTPLSAATNATKNGGNAVRGISGDPKPKPPKPVGPTPDGQPKENAH